MIDLRTALNSGARWGVGVALLGLLAGGAACADDAPKPTYIDLQPYGNHKLTDNHGTRFEGNNLGNVPKGEQTFAGRKFKVGEKLVLLHGNMDNNLPDKVEGIKVNAGVDELCILHATEYVLNDGEEEKPDADKEIGAYVVHYADGAEVRIPIEYGKDLCDWWAYQFNPVPTRAKIAWEGTNQAAEEFDNLKIRLYAIVWTNPHPDKEIATIDFVSKNTICQPFLVAMTADTAGSSKADEKAKPEEKAKPDDKD